MLLSIESPLKTILVVQITSVALDFTLTLYLIAMEICTFKSFVRS